MISVEYFVTDVRAAQTTKIEHGAKLTCECGKDLKCGKWDDFRKREVEHFVESDKFLERRNDIHRGANSGSLAFDEAYKRVQRLIESDGLKERGNYVASGLKVDSIRCGECLGDLLLTANVRYEAPTSLTWDVERIVDNLRLKDSAVSAHAKSLLGLNAKADLKIYLDTSHTRAAIEALKAAQAKVESIPYVLRTKGFSSFVSEMSYHTSLLEEEVKARKMVFLDAIVKSIRDLMGLEREGTEPAKEVFMN